MLKDNNLLDSPWIGLRVNKDSVITLYLSKKDYQQFKNYSYEQLIASKEKVRISAEVDHIMERYFLCTKLLSVEKIEGDTFIKSRKFKIEDYR